MSDSNNKIVEKAAQAAEAIAEIQPKPKEIKWQGSSKTDLMNAKLFPVDAKREAGHQLYLVQNGLDPDHWKPFNDVGSGTKEIIIDLEDGWYRVMYVSKFEEAVYVLHCFKKKTNKTIKTDVDIAKARYKDVIKQRKNLA